MGTNGDQSTEEFGLFDSLGREWIKLPTAAMREVGPAAQTLGGLLKVTNRETFAAVCNIARKARLPTKTTRNHLTSLTEAGWIVNAGRERTRRGAPRRTCTVRVAKKTTEAIRRVEAADDLLYGVLPWWATLQGTTGMPWSAKAVLSVVMARLMASKAAIVEQEGKADLSTEDWWGSLANLGGEDRFRFSLVRLEELTGLDHKSIIQAKRKLQELKVIRWYGCKRDDGGDDKHMLYPNEEFRVVVKPAGEGRCYVSYRGDGKNGH